jgi:excinuclease ABC subunit C
MTRDGFNKIQLPNSPGVYFFTKGKTILYIGKATSLRDRVRSYFAKDLIVTRGPHILDMVTQADSIRFEKTDTVLEALILEANLIKKHWPNYNTKEKDNKSFQYVVITKEAFPKVLIVRGRALTVKSQMAKIVPAHIFGPYPSGTTLRDALRIIRKIFPYIDENSAKRDNYEFYRQLGLSPEVGTSEFQEAYQENIKNLILFFQGKKKEIVRRLKIEMKKAAKELMFEKAGKIKHTLFSLTHINDIALIKDDTIRNPWSSRFRVEAFDVAHLSGESMVGVMTVVVDGVLAKDEYKKFNIKTQTKSNDTGALEEILSRRFRHAEWGMPDLIVVDGSIAQINVAERVLRRYQLVIPVVAVTKDVRHKPEKISGTTDYIKSQKNAILLANNESHRFAISFHKQKRTVAFLAK